MKSQKQEKLEIKERRIFSDSLKKEAVKSLVNKRVTIDQLMKEHQVSSTTQLGEMFRRACHLN